MPLLEVVLVFLSAGLAGIGLARVLRLSPILGSFIVGAAIGEHGIGLVQDTT